MNRSRSADGPREIPGRDALRAVAGGPRLTLEELRIRLGVSAATFIDVWEGRRALAGSARDRLAEVLREEIRWREEVLFGLQRAREQEVGQAHMEERDEPDTGRAGA